MIVWFVYDYHDFLGVFSTKEKAEEYKAKYCAQESDYSDDVRVEEVEVDERL